MLSKFKDGGVVISTIRPTVFRFRQSCSSGAHKGLSLSVFLSELAFSLQLNTADVDWLIKPPVSFFLCSDWLIHSKPFLAVETCPFYVNTFNSQLNTIPQLCIKHQTHAQNFLRNVVVVFNNLTAELSSLFILMEVKMFFYIFYIIFSVKK